MQNHVPRDAAGLRGKTALVTGAARGIGRAISLALAAQGVRVIAVARSRDALSNLAAEAPAGLVQPSPGDLTAAGCVEGLAREAGDGLSILVHSAGVISQAPLSDAQVEHLDLQYQVNLRAAYTLTKVLRPALISNVGDVVFINSSVTQFPRPHSGQFAATQHALIGFADSLREELNPLGVRVLTIFPGRTATARQAHLHELSGAPYHPERLLQPQEVATMLVAALGLPRTAEVTELRIRPAAKSG